MRQLWKDDTVLEARAFSHQRRQITAGEAGADFFLPSDFVGAPGVCLAHIFNDEVRIIGEAATAAEVSGPDGKRQVLRGGVAEGFVLPVGAVATVWFGPVGFRLCHVLRPAGIVSGLAERVDFLMLNSLLLMLFVMAGVFATLHLRPRAVAAAEEELSRIPDRVVRFMLSRAQPEHQDFVFVPRLRIDIDERPAAPRAPGVAGKAGLPGRPDTGRRTAAKAIKLDDKVVVGQKGLIYLWGTGDTQTASTILGGTGLGGEMEAAIGNVDGALPGDSGGFGGMAPRGTGTGGGGPPDIIGSDELNLGGRVRPRGEPGGPKVALRAPEERTISINVGKPVIIGPLSMEVIRQVIASHRDQIRYCYSQELNRKPRLAGKISVRFTIGEGGYVSRAAIAQSTVGDAALEECLVRKIGAWKFPAPRGGVVIVNYPFIFTAPGM
ncbi:MAG: AgmX/PglI C-terminal domain-containing protein [Myxococcales bacterium]|nr:AgmX/PglI C-terminal domain-containing protein [Myxococcales bacterium]